uniref:C2H2-type domain-containing protein n=1 Tax=Acrobeloides nanus TaxID=290746 RepID=A0A914CEQ3_9BILA
MDISLQTLSEDEQFFENSQPRNGTKMAAMWNKMTTMEQDNIDLRNATVALFDLATPPPVVHQCAICDKIFRSYRALVMHAAVHSNELPYVCETCGKAFRYRSNLITHKSLHEGYTPYTCSLCDKKSRIRCNMKKHLRQHVTTDGEFEEIWKQYELENPLKKRRKSKPNRGTSEISPDAIVIRSHGEPLVSKPIRPRKYHKLGLGMNADIWIKKIQSGQTLGTLTLEEKLEHLQNRQDVIQTVDELFKLVEGVPFEVCDCPVCGAHFLTKNECMVHLVEAHPNLIHGEFFCEICVKTFALDIAMKQHKSYHERVRFMLENDSIEMHEPTFVDFEANDEKSVVEEIQESRSDQSI